jgi:hypothetical protein
MFIKRKFDEQHPSAASVLPDVISLDNSRWVQPSMSIVSLPASWTNCCTEPEADVGGVHRLLPVVGHKRR